ncbi:MAG TPA: GNAT family N-acetyltransferase [Gemmatimonadales bacterium]
MNLVITHDPSRHRFEAVVDGLAAFLEYRPVGPDELDFVSTWVAPPLRKRGVGLLLVEHALGYARERGYRVIPSCWFVRDVLDAAGEAANPRLPPTPSHD